MREERGMNTRTGKGHTDSNASHTLSPASIEKTVHDLRNALAGVRGAVQIVREPMVDGTMEREILGEVLARVDDMDAMLLALAANEPSARE
jgi:nitrogen-specific signal transduction histidine kinase